MMKVEKVTESNCEKLKQINLKSDQISFADSPVDAYSDSKQFKGSTPYLILNNDKVIGFIIVEDLSEASYLIWNFMIDQQYQGMGFGKRSMDMIIEMIKSNLNGKKIELGVIPDNLVAKKLYLSLGFISTGKFNSDNEEIMVLRL